MMKSEDEDDKIDKKKKKKITKTLDRESTA